MSFIEDTSSEDAGTVMVWSGTISNIPSGYLLCDGNNGTEDLRDSFIRCPADYSDGTGATGGNSTITVSKSQLPSHNHDPVSINTSGSHNHSVDLASANKSTDFNERTTEGSNESSTSAGSHSHSAAQLDQIGSGQSVDMDPQHYEVAFIQKI